MTINSTSRTAGPFIGNGLTRVFPFSFKVFAREDVLVAVTNTATSVETILALDTDYAVALNGDQNANPGGTITMTVAPAIGTTLAATSNIPYLQKTDLTNQGGFYPRVISDALDKITIQIQQLAGKVGTGLNVGGAAALAMILNFIPQVGGPSGASLIGFIQSGIASVKRTVEDVLREESWGSVLNTGAKGDGITDDSAAVIAQLADRRGGWAYVRFTAGRTYFIAQSIVVPSNTVIEIEQGAVVQLSGSTSARFFNAAPGSSGSTGGYGMSSNIIFTGKGVIDCNGGSGAVGFAHATGVLFEGITFRNAANTHFIEINSSKDVTCRQLTFQDMTYTSGLYEMLQFDYSNAAGFPSFGPYDNTPCTNVLVENCVFRNGHSGLGSHNTPPGTLHTKIRVRDCAFYNMNAAGIRVQGWGAGSEVAGNYLESCGAKVIQIVGGTTDLDVAGNTIVGGATSWAIGCGVSSNLYPYNIKIRNNKVYDPVGDALYFTKLTNGDVFKNEIFRAQMRAVRVEAGCSGVYIRENRIWGASYLTNNTYEVFYVIDASDDIRIERNIVKNMGNANVYKYGVYLEAGVTNARINGNQVDTAGTAQINNGGTATEIEGETFLTGVLAQTSGAIALTDDITKYQRVRVATGVAAAGGLVTDEARGWATNGFRAGSDFVNVRSKNGSVIMSVDAARTLTIQGTAVDAVRYVIGIGRS